MHQIRGRATGWARAIPQRHFPRGPLSLPRRGHHRPPATVLGWPQLIIRVMHIGRCHLQLRRCRGGRRAGQYSQGLRRCCRVRLHLNFLRPAPPSARRSRTRWITRSHKLFESPFFPRSPTRPHLRHLICPASSRTSCPRDVRRPHQDIGVHGPRIQLLACEARRPLWMVLRPQVAHLL